jgi:hypothetical protein
VPLLEEIVPDDASAAPFHAATWDAVSVAGLEPACAFNPRTAPKRTRRITVPHEADRLRQFIGRPVQFRRLFAAVDCGASKLEKLLFQLIESALRMKKNPF